MKKIWKLADVSVSVDFTHPYLMEQCRTYESDESPVLSLVVTKDDIVLERRKSNDITSYPDAYYESLAFYRKFAVATLDHSVLLIHGSAVCFHGRGYIFAAPSGTGKSTHARLCKSYYGNEMTYINDDKPLLRYIDGIWYVYGTPWDGKHHLSENLKAPLGGICLLERGETNSIRQSSYDDALPALLSQIYRPNDEASMRKTLNLTLSLGKLPFWQLKCTISKEAARLSLGTMETCHQKSC